MRLDDLSAGPEVPSAEPGGWPRPRHPTDRHEALAMTEHWLAALERNRVERHPIPWDDGIDVAPFPRRALLKSLATFQLGESGDGAHLRLRAERQSHPAYADAIDLFVAEEQEHARLLAEVLGRLGAPLRTSHWSDGAFVAVRHVAGLRTELLVLMAAELIALRYYGLLAHHARDPALRAVGAQILSGEIGHVGFHCDHLAWGVGAWPRPLRRLVGGAWWLFLRAVSWVVAWDHRSVIRATGQTCRGFVADCAVCFKEVHRRIFGTSRG